MSSSPGEVVDVDNRKVFAPDSDTTPVSAACSTPARGSLYGRIVGSVCVGVFVSSLGITFGIFRACITAPAVVAVAVAWEYFSSHSLPTIDYAPRLLLQYAQAGVFGACAFTVPLGIAAGVIIGASTSRSRGPYANLKERYRRYKAKRAEEARQPGFRLKKLAFGITAMAVTASLVPAGVLAFRWWYGSGMELLLENNCRVLALAVLDDVLASLYMKWRRLSRKASKGSGPSAEDGQGPVLDAVVVDMPKQ